MPSPSPTMQHLFELDRGADVAFELFDAEGFALHHAVLPTARSMTAYIVVFPSVVILV